MQATAIAHPNLALVKYWGKRDIHLNLPAAGSLSVTLAGLRTRTTVTFTPGQARDAAILNGRAVWGAKLDRVIRFLDLLRHRAGVDLHATVHTENDFPTAAGLASSSSGFAALAAAGSAALGLELSAPELSVLARLGSGSAARSIHGGFVEMMAGRLPDGSDAHAIPIAYEDHWDLRCLILLTAQGEKSIGSTEAMNHTATTSPY
ncbi:MAG: diphosphomevalonate decarboxylase, partial [Myxococcota bacterium]